MPDVIRYYLNEEPVIRNVDTWRCGEPDHLTEVMDRLDEPGPQAGRQAPAARAS
ncbi:circularly permuted type 2 ATP-grasp protein [Nocardioides convexus]|uniref:circularly permuted type 2 ATP-grasp protein n=1 Tax=Nocardioides convexus TaxID=2712224 RepID=UPI0024185410|nr:circularly permuted type 2 ATP-grasp protein [Nocardioides convexus]